LSVREEPGRPLLDTLTAFVGAKKVLLVLDNCEHLVAACAQVAETLLRACSGLRILATCREVLGCAGETGWRVPSLSLPDPLQVARVEDLSQCESAHLFCERAAAMQPAFVLTDRNAPAVAEICLRLDGLPLAIELAAARVKVFSAEQIAARLDDRFALLTGGARTALPRQKTLRGMIDWSYDLLSGPEQALMRRLSVFVGGWTFEAAAAICAGDPVGAGEILSLLGQLIDKSLVSAVEEDGAVRYQLLETIRQYADDKLEEAGEAERYRRGHLAFFLAFAEEAAPALEGAEQAIWLERLETEHDNLRMAQSCSLRKGFAESGLRLAAALGGFWAMRGYFAQGRGWLERALAGVTAPVAADAATASARAKALLALAELARRQGDYNRVAQLIEESLAMYREQRDARGIADALDNLGEMAQVRPSRSAAPRTIGRLREIVARMQARLDPFGGNNRGGPAPGECPRWRAPCLLRASLPWSPPCAPTGRARESAGGYHLCGQVPLRHTDCAPAQQVESARVKRFTLSGTKTLNTLLGQSGGSAQTGEWVHAPVGSSRLRGHLDSGPDSH
jgi:non-specific serine/threonine protein kinase